MKKLQGLTKKHIHSAIENKKLSSDDELHQLGAGTYSRLFERNKQKRGTIEHLHEILKSILGKFSKPFFSEDFSKYRLHLERKVLAATDRNKNIYYVFPIYKSLKIQ